MMLLPVFLHVYIKRVLPRLWPKGVEITREVAEVARASRSGAGGCGEERVVEMEKWFSLVTLDIIGSSGFGYGFRAVESASIRGSSNTKEKSGFELADACNTTPNMGGPSRTAVMPPIIFPFHLVQSLPPKQTRDAVGAASNLLLDV